MHCFLHIPHPIKNKKSAKNGHFLAKKSKKVALFLKNLLKSDFFCVKMGAIYVLRMVVFMNITDVRVRLVKKEEGKLKGVASVTFDDCFVVHDIKIIEGNEGYFIAMPSRKTGEGEYKDIAHPIKTETREELIKVILSAFDAEKANQE